jgi:predicted phosphoribosyltransferase
MLAAVAAVRTLGPCLSRRGSPGRRARQAVKALRAAADLVVCLSSPEPIHAVGAAYEDFRQLSDAEVVAILDEFPLLSLSPPALRRRRPPCRRDR